MTTDQPAASPALAHAEGQLRFYDTRATQYRRNEHAVTIISIVIGVVGAALSGHDEVPRLVLGILAATVAALQALPPTFQWRERWTSYRAAAEELRSQIALYQAEADAYADNPHRDRLLAERVYTILRNERGEWIERQRAQRAGIPTAAPAA